MTSMNEIYSLIQALLTGHDIVTGETFDPKEYAVRPKTKVALKAALKLLDSHSYVKWVPVNEFRFWSKSEDYRLMNGFEFGASFEALAAIHQRTVAQISGRLEELRHTEI